MQSRAITLAADTTTTGRLGRRALAAGHHAGRPARAGCTVSEAPISGVAARASPMLVVYPQHMTLSCLVGRYPIHDHESPDWLL